MYSKHMYVDRVYLFVYLFVVVFVAFCVSEFGIIFSIAISLGQTRASNPFLFTYVDMPVYM
jgi:hypothetical protein